VTLRKKPARRAHPASTRRRARARRKRARIAATVIAVPLIVAALVVGGAFLVVSTPALVAPSALAPADDPPAAQAPAQLLDQEQRDNAVTIVAAGADLGLSTRDQTIAVMAALGESSLRNIDYGDWETSGVTNPDGTRTTSIGLFQQQDSWGTREQRLDPYTAATLFYRAMLARVPNRDQVEPTLVAHRTQINRDPDHYARYWSIASNLVEELSGSGLQP